MNEETAKKLMLEAIEEAKQSKCEDDRQHPKVGAVLSDENGKILLRSHRGQEVPGGHAEFHIFRNAKRQGVDVRGKILFVTLEPCIRRGEKKTPCAVRVA